MFNDLGYLARLTLFCGLFFASSGVAVGDGGAGGDEGAGGEEGGAGAGDEGAGDQGAEGAESEQGAIGEGEEAGEGEEGEEGAEDRKLGPQAQAAEVKKALEKIRAADPESAKTLRKAFFKKEQEIGGYRKSFKTAAEASEAHDLLEIHGGADGIAELKQQTDDYVNELLGMERGDPALIENMARDFPKGLIKLAPMALEKLRTLDAPAYERTIAKHMVSALKDKGVANTISRIGELIADGKQEPAFQLAKQLKDWIASVESFALTVAKDEPNERDKEIAERERGVQTREQKIFYGQVHSAVLSRQQNIIDKALGSYLKQRKLTPEQRQELSSGIRGRIARALEADDRYQDRLKALLEKGDVQAVTRFIADHTQQRVAKAASREWTARGFAGDTTKRAAGGGSGAAAAVGSKPASDQVDWSKDPRKLRYIGDGVTGEYTDKKGNVHRFKW
jgi:hypothetical protein